MPKSAPRLVVDRVKLVLVFVVFISSVCVQQIPNKSHSQELNNVLFVDVVVVQMNGCSLCHQVFNSALSPIILYTEVSSNFLSVGVVGVVKLISSRRERYYNALKLVT